MLSDLANVRWSTAVTDLFSPWSPETARTRWRPEDSCYPGEEATRWGPQWLVLHWKATGGGSGAPGFRTEGASRQHLQAEQRQVSATNPINAELTWKNTFPPFSVWRPCVAIFCTDLFYLVMKIQHQVFHTRHVAFCANAWVAPSVCHRSSLSCSCWTNIDSH